MHNSSSPALPRAVIVLLIGATCLHAGGTDIRTAYSPEPAADIWMYSNASGGTRTTASTFSFLPFTGVDDRFAQFVIKFNTVAAGIPAGLGPANYDLHHLELTCVYQTTDSIPYDPSEDPLVSLGAAATLVDPDPGRPLELHGTGFRGGFTAATYQESSPYGSRNAYASGFDTAGVARDVSNNVTNGFESHPWAIGKAAAPVDLNADPRVYVPINPGETITKYSHITFDVDFSKPGVAEYVRHGLHQGFLWFTLSSFHSVSSPESTGFPAYFTRDHGEQALFGDVAPTLKVTYSLPLRVVTFTRDPATNSCHLAWNASPGFSYAVQRCTDLTENSWVTLTPAPLARTTPGLLGYDAIGLSTRSFFRIVRTP